MRHFAAALAEMGPIPNTIYGPLSTARGLFLSRVRNSPRALPGAAQNKSKQTNKGTLADYLLISLWDQTGPFACQEKCDIASEEAESGLPLEKQRAGGVPGDGVHDRKERDPSECF